MENKLAQSGVLFPSTQLAQAAAVAPSNSRPLGSPPDEVSGRDTKRRFRLAVLVTAGIAALSPRTPRKLALALSFLASYEALHYLSGRKETGRAPYAPTERMILSDTAAEAMTSSPRADLSVNVKAEAVYPRIYIDRSENVPDGSGHYQIAGDMDMRASWWSVTIYDEEFDLLRCKVDRHTFTSLNTVPREDGHHFVIDIAPECPAGAVNWLPCVGGEPFTLVWRLYLPGAHILDPWKGFQVPKVISVAD